MTGDTLSNATQHTDEADARQHGESLFQATRDAAPRVTVFARRAEGGAGAARRGPKLSQDEHLAAIQAARGPRAVEAARSLLSLAGELSLHIGMSPRSAFI